jgi:peptide/nickel transport system substrate-binding protein
MAALGTAAALVLSGCGGPATSSGSGASELVVGRVESIDGMSGDSCLGSASIQTMPMIYGQLLTATEDGLDLTGGLAEDYEYDAKSRTYTLAVREGASFSNGDPLTADDVVFSIDQWRNGRNSGAYYEMIKSARAVDEHTVEISLSHPDTFLPALLTWCTSTVYPKDFAGLSEEEYFKKPISAGPYSLVSWSNPGPSEQLVLEKNDGWYGAADGEPHIDKIEIRTTADLAQQVLAFESGAVDVIENITHDEASQLAPEAVHDSAPSHTQDLMLNSNLPALADKDVRTAISLGINREAIAEVVGGGAVPAENIFPINVPNSVLADDPQHYDPDAAKALMAGKKVPDLKLTFEGGTSALRNAANLIREDLGELGINVTLSPSDSASLFDMASSGDFELLINGVSAISPTIFDPISFLATSWYGWTGADAEVMQDQYLRGTTTFDDATREDAVRAIQNDVEEQRTVVGLYHEPTSAAVAPGVQHLVPLQYGLWNPSIVELDRS